MRKFFININIRKVKIKIWKPALCVKINDFGFVSSESEDSGHPGIPPSLIRVFSVSIGKAKGLSKTVSTQQ